MKDGRFLLRTFDCCSWELHEVYFSKEAAEKCNKMLCRDGRIEWLKQEHEQEDHKDGKL